MKMELTNGYNSNISRVSSTKTEQKNYKFLVESIKDYAIIMLDTAGHIISWNKEAEQINGYSAQEALGKHIAICYTEEDNEKEIPQLNLKMAVGLGWFEEEGWRVRKDGSLFWANVTITALRDEQGKLVGFGKVTKDLTARKAADAEIEGLITELQIQLEKSQTEMLDYKRATQQIANSLHINNLSTVLVNVSYRQPGNVVKHIPVVFTIWKNENYFKAFALCNEQTQRILNLPDALPFQLKHGKPTAPRQAYERIVMEIAEELTKINVIAQ